MYGEINVNNLIEKCWELETSVVLWSAANEAKVQRIQELEDECNRLRQRVARLGRQVGRRQRSSNAQQIRC